MTLDTPHFSPRSLACAGALQMRLVATSANTGWSSCLLDHMEGDNVADPHETQMTPDFRVVVATRGAHDIEVLRDGRWRSAIYQVGAVGLTPGGETTRFKRRNRTVGSLFRQAFLHIPSGFLLQAAELVRRPGQRLSAEFAHTLVVDEPVAVSVVASLLQAMANGAPDTYAETAVRWLSLHLVSRFGGRSVDHVGARDGVAMTDARFARALEFITANLARQISVAEIANEAGVSPFHFTRLFARRLGMPPHAYLTHCRMEKAQRLLATTDLPIAVVAAECGYAVGSSFSSAFTRHFGQPPSTMSRPTRK